ncbi:low molecular weight protein-tyrosine-phosphatase [Nakamurella endophytica]|uniref:protein-tyrosine-phosphatase n=1 Tax=Nakamurella endophytica TaxID=1748367 RepID=A0A917TD17_9ACTN|nr:low molecular weight protein-tyrosine-phosphatase [Nakamurella endophytica]GGM17777.1 protein-tyrosine-phosphatase [Nakamurella endophytica]
MTAADRTQGDDRLHVCIVCTGNICRSPIAEQMLRTAVDAAGLSDRVRVSSAAIGPWHVGLPADPRAVAALARAGYPGEHVARQVDEALLDGIDLALAADRGHQRKLRRMTTDPDKVRLLRSFDPAADHDDVPDPYYGTDAAFDEVVAMTAAALPGILAEIERRLAPAASGGRR